jgi:hypothetical protein
MGPSVCNHWLEETSAEEVILLPRNRYDFFGGDCLITLSHRIDSSHDLWNSGSKARRQEIRGEVKAIEFTDPNFWRPPEASEITWTL